jgi:hypothetical protein
MADETIYRASRWRLALWIGLGLLVGLIGLNLPVEALTESSPLQGKAAIFRLLSPDMRLLIVRTIAVVALACAASLMRLLFDTRVAVLDEKGLWVRQMFGPPGAARWTDFAGVRRIGQRLSIVLLQFDRRGRKRLQTIMLPPQRITGIDRASLVDDIERRIAAAKNAPRRPVRGVAAASPGARRFGRRRQSGA